MAKRELISREEALSHPFANGKYDHKNADINFILGHESYKEWLETLPVFTEQDIVKPYLEAIEKKVKELSPERGMWEIGGDIAKETVCEMIVDVLEILHNIDNLLSEQEAKE